jgi:hypothetical protein
MPTVDEQIIDAKHADFPSIPTYSSKGYIVKPAYEYSQGGMSTYNGPGLAPQPAPNEGN